MFLTSFFPLMIEENLPCTVFDLLLVEGCILHALGSTSSLSLEGT